MAPTDNVVSATFKSLWHSLTSDDRHANYDSPFRSATSSQSSFGIGRNPELAAIATDSTGYAGSGPYGDGSGEASRSNTALASVGGIYSPRPGTGTSSGRGSPALYSPGSRTSTLKPNESTTISGIPLQDFAADGSPPPPPVSHSWSRIDRWAEDNYPELFDQLGEQATVNDINELEHRLDCSLPSDVRESLQIHDGQERGGTPTGIIFSAMLLDCEEMVDEWKQWQTVRSEFLAEKLPQAMSNGRSSGPPGQGRAALLARQDSQPEGAVQKLYCHPGWIPMVRDWGGNNIGIDLAPGPKGKWGQVIVFGRDYDCKYVVARSWANFLANVADDLESSNWYVNEDSGELKLRELKTTRVEPGYFDILRLRTDRKYGRRPPPQPRRRPMAPPNVQTGNGPVGPRPGSSSPGNLTPRTPMPGLSPVVSAADRAAMPPPQRSLSPLHAPTAIRPMGKVLEDVQSSAGDKTPTSRRSMQSNREIATPPPIKTDTKKDDMDDLTDLIQTPTADPSFEDQATKVVEDKSSRKSSDKKSIRVVTPTESDDEEKK